MTSLRVPTCLAHLGRNEGLDGTHAGVIGGGRAANVLGGELKRRAACGRTFRSVCNNGEAEQSLETHKIVEIYDLLTNDHVKASANALDVVVYNSRGRLRLEELRTEVR